MAAGAIEQHTGADHVSMNEVQRRINAAIDMGFSREINHSVKLVFRHERVHLVGIGNVGLEEFVAIAMCLGHAIEIGEVAGVSQDIDIRDVGRLVMFQNVANKVAANETAAARNQNAHRLAY
jgi:hypothetical protein